MTPFVSGQSLAHGRYTVQRPLSEGGMGTLYLAIDHEAFDRMVVVKVLRPAPGATDTEVAAFRTRFAHEARTLATLSYPTIPQIFAYFQDGPQTCIVMAYIAGNDLEQQLTRVDPATGTLRLGQAYDYAHVLAWGIELCRTLEYMAARQSPVVHHDIKPANIVLSDSSSHLFLVDFGSAVAHRCEPADPQAPTDAAYGTPGYAPPEQYRGQSEPRSDVYALAATLYHLASDDDPTQHRFAFPHLDQLGGLGQALRPALDLDVAKRPSAIALRQSLEQLHVAATTRLLHTPDGSVVADQRALVAWCANHWPHAAMWLYKGLPDEMEAVWGHDIARDLRAIVSRYNDHNVGLDAALALLDPADFGVQRPDLAADSEMIQFGSLGSQATSTRQLILSNAGRRYVQAQIDPPDWIAPDVPTLGLIPGRQVVVTLTAQRTATTTGWRLDDDLIVHTSTAMPLHLRAQARLPTIERWFRPALALLIVGLLAITVPALLIMGLAAPLPAVDVQGVYAVPTAIVPTPTPRARFVTPAAPMPVPRSAPARPRGDQPAAGSVSRVINGHISIWNVTWSPDGKLLASVGRDGAIRVWRTSDSTPIRVLKGYGDWLGSVAWSPDSKTIASGGVGSQVVLRHVDDDSWRQNLDGSSATVLSVAWSPDGALLASGSSDGTIRLWRVSDGTLLRALMGHSAEVQSVAFSPDGTLLASGSRDKTIRTWRVSDGAPLRILSKHSAAVVSVAWNRAGTLLASGSDDHTVMVWSVSDGIQRQVLTAAQSGIFSVAWSPDGTRLAFGGADQRVWMWQVGAGGAPTPIANTQQRVLSIAWNPDGHTLVAGGADGKLWFWAIP